jgi:predicted ester cyclase
MMRDYFHRAYDLGDATAVDDHIAPDVLSHGLSLEPTTGRQFFKEWYVTFLSAFSDVSCPISHTWVDGDWVIVRVLFSGTHTGDGLGIPPTGRQISVSALVAARVVNNQVVESFNEFNRLALLQQLGVNL